MSERHTPSLGSAIAVMLVDWLAIFVFVYAGLGSHQQQITLGAILLAAWPFLVGRMLALVTAWPFPGLRALAVPATGGRAEVLWPSGVLAWLLTWALGMAVRALTGGGTALAFVLVSLGVLGGLFLGWRLLSAAVRWQVRRNTELDTAG